MGAKLAGRALSSFDIVNAASASEFGDQSFYRAPGRKIAIGVQLAFDPKFRLQTRERAREV